MVGNSCCIVRKEVREVVYELMMMSIINNYMMRIVLFRVLFIFLFVILFLFYFY